MESVRTNKSAGALAIGCIDLDKYLFIRINYWATWCI